MVSAFRFRWWYAGIAVWVFAASCSGDGKTGSDATSADVGHPPDAVDGRAAADAPDDAAATDAPDDAAATDAPDDAAAAEVRADRPPADAPDDGPAPDADQRASTDAPADAAGPPASPDAREGGSDADPCAGCSFTKIAADGMHLVHDATRGRLYVTQLSTAAHNPNTLAIIDVATAAITANVPIGKDPRPLALSDDASTLWVGLASDHAIRKVSLSDGAPSVGPLLAVPPEIVNNLSFPAWPVDLKVLPGSATTLVASVTSSGTSTREYVFDDGVPRPTIAAPREAASRLAVGPPGYVFGYDSVTSGFGLSVFTVAGPGITLLSTTSGLIGGFEGFVVYDRGRLFSFYGEVVDVSDPTKPVRAGKFSYAGAIAVRDATHVFMASPSFLIGNGDVPQLRLFDTTTLTQVASVAVPANLIPATSMFTDLVYLGGDALAFITEDYDNHNVVYIAHVPSLTGAP